MIRRLHSYKLHYTGLTNLLRPWWSRRLLWLLTGADGIVCNCKGLSTGQCCAVGFSGNDLKRADGKEDLRAQAEGAWMMARLTPVLLLVGALSQPTFSSLRREQRTGRSRFSLVGLP